MDDYAIRPRYARRKVPPRRKRKGARPEYSFRETLIKQLFVAVLILLVLWGLEALNAPFADSASGAVGRSLGKDYNLSSIYSGFDRLVTYMKGSSLFDRDKAGDGGSKTEDTRGTGNQQDQQSQQTQQTQQDQLANNASAQNDNEGTAVKSSTTQQGYMVDAAEMESIVNAVKSKYTFISPVQGTVTSDFGEREHPVKKTSEFHKGIDIEADKGASIKAALGGEVIEAGAEKTYGNYIKIKHSDNIATIYAHCSVLSVKKGQVVKQGDIIAKVGDTGLSVGAHLHFEIWKDSVPLNPLNFIKVG